MSSIMHQTAAESISQMPASTAKFEKDLKVFHDRTGEAFPEVLKLPILIQMIPSSRKKEFETLLRASGAIKTCEALAQQLANLGHEERYTENRLGHNDMDIDAADRAWAAASFELGAQGDWNDDEYEYTAEDIKLGAECEASQKEQHEGS